MMRIYRWKKPELTVTLTAGGTLLANTTYYLAGYFRSRLGGYVYWGACGPMSAIQSFTTDSSNKSISVAWQTSGDITGFSAGGVATIVESEGHCLTSGDYVIIQSGTYAGTWSITWIDYDRFSIDETFDGTETASWLCETLHNGADSIVFFMDTTNPVNQNGITWSNTTSRKMSHRQYDISYTSTPVAVTAPYSIQTCSYSVPILRGDYNFDRSYKYIFDLGMPAIVGAEASWASDDAFIQDLQYEFESAGLSPYCTANQRTNNNGLTFFGFLEFNSLYMVLDDASIFVTYGNIKLPHVTFDNCVVQYQALTTRAWAQYIARNCQTNAASNSGFDVFPTSYGSTYTNQWGIGATIDLTSRQYSGLAIVDGGMGVSYPRAGYVHDSKMENSGFIYTVYNPSYYPPEGHRTLVNFTQTKNTYSQDMTIYTYQVNTPYTQHYENYNTDREDNLKKFVMNTSNSDIDIVCHRTGIIYLSDDINEASCVITSASGDVYTYSSNEDGEIAFDIVEQYSYPRRNVYDDNIQYDFYIEISKDGYDTYETTVHLAQDIGGMPVTLPTPTYYQQQITGSVTSDEISGLVALTSITGIVATDNITGVVEND